MYGTLFYPDKILSTDSIGQYSALKNSKIALIGSFWSKTNAIG